MIAVLSLAGDGEAGSGWLVVDGVGSAGCDVG